MSFAIHTAFNVHACAHTHTHTHIHTSCSSPLCHFYCSASTLLYMHSICIPTLKPVLLQCITSQVGKSPGTGLCKIFFCIYGNYLGDSFISQVADDLQSLRVGFDVHVDASHQPVLETLRLVATTWPQRQSLSQSGTDDAHINVLLKVLKLL